MPKQIPAVYHRVLDFILANERKNNPWLAPDAIEKATGLEARSFQPVISRAEQAGLVERKRDPGDRVSVVRGTFNGRTLDAAVKVYQKTQQLEKTTPPKHRRKRAASGEPRALLLIELTNGETLELSPQEARTVHDQLASFFGG